MHLRDAETNAGDASLREFNHTFAYLRQLEELKAVLIGAELLFHAGLLLQRVVLAESCFVQQVVHHLAAMAAEILAVVHAVLFSARIATMETSDLRQYLGLHGCKERAAEAQKA